MGYLKWDSKIVNDFSDKNINSLYNDGYLFTRTIKGSLYQTISLRIDLDQFELSSENRRILKKTNNIQTQTRAIPYSGYHWSIHKMGKDFYTIKFGDKIFSANKIKELMTDKKNSNFNIVFVYSQDSENKGYCIAIETNELIHYSYPFYNLKNTNKDMGMGMMTKAIVYTKENNKKYIYLGSFSRPTDIYKLQFKGLEWFDGEKWKNDLEELKNTL